MTVEFEVEVEVDPIIRERVGATYDKDVWIEAAYDVVQSGDWSKQEFKDWMKNKWNPLTFTEWSNFFFTMRDARESSDMMTVLTEIEETLMERNT
jgi:hypothetical protein